MTNPAYDRCAICLQPGHVSASCPRTRGHRALTLNQDDSAVPPSGGAAAGMPSGADRARLAAAAPAVAAALGLVGPRQDTAAARRRRALDIMHRRLVSQLRNVAPS